MKKVSLKINGQTRQLVAPPDLVLLDLLRLNLGLTGAKQSCDRKGPMRRLYGYCQRPGRKVLSDQGRRPG